MAEINDGFSDSRIDEEYQRLKKQFTGIPENKQILLEQLLRNSAFMAIQLKDMQEAISEEGATEIYQHGEKQSGKKPSAMLQAYNVTLKSYNAVQRQLLNFAPNRLELLNMEKNQNPSVVPERREKTDADRAEEERREEEKQKKLEADIKRAEEELQRRHKSVQNGGL